MSLLSCVFICGHLGLFIVIVFVLLLFFCYHLLVNKVSYKGLTFVPHKNNTTYTELNNDILRFERKLQLQLFFHNKSHTNKKHLDQQKNSTLSSNSTWWPKKLDISPASVALLHREDRIRFTRNGNLEMTYGAVESKNG